LIYKLLHSKENQKNLYMLFEEVTQTNKFNYFIN